jgi:hypothetical protein
MFIDPPFPTPSSHMRKSSPSGSSASATGIVIEIASNDGYLLKNYRSHGIPVLGIEPARNIARIAWEQWGVETIEKFFGRELAERLASEGRHADVIHANNVLAHVRDLNGVLRGIHNLLKEDGEAIVEVPYLLDMIDKIEFNTIYHEHLCYFSLTALVGAFACGGLTMIDVEHLDIHGGSLRIFARRAGAPGEPPKSGAIRVEAMLAAERHWGVDDASRKLVGLLRRLKAEGHTIAAYGASAKGTTLLNYCGLGEDEIDYVVDRSTLKQGRMTPGTRIPIVSAGTPVGNPAPLCTSAGMELRRGGDGAAGRISAMRRTLHRSSTVSGCDLGR